MSIRLRYSFLLFLTIPSVAFSQRAWRTVNPMNTPRFCSALAPLPNGTILSIGGQDINLNSFSSCEIFDPATGKWTFTAPLAVPRGVAKFVSLSDGRVAVIGGQTSASVAQTDLVEIYDPTLHTWKASGHLLRARQNETLNYVDDSTIFVIGGLTSTGVTSECEIYNAVAQTSRKIASMHQNRHGHMSIVLSSGEILVVGGRDGGSSSHYLNECELYDPALDTWTVISPMAQSRIEGVLTQFPDGSILAAGGRNTPETSAPGSEILDLGSMSWSNIDPLLQPVTASGNVVLPNSRYLITAGAVGGDYSIYSNNVTTPTCEWYDRSQQKWYYAPSLNLSRDKFPATYLHQTVTDLLPTDLVMVAGGLVGIIDSSHGNTFSPYITNSAEVLDVTTPSMLYYMQHQPITASVGNSSAPAGTDVKITYDANLDASLDLSVDQAGLVTIVITDVRGVAVSRYESYLIAGKYSILTNRLSLRNGFYFVHVSAGGTDQMEKFAVEK